MRYRVVIGLCLSAFIYPAYADGNITGLASTCNNCHGSGGVSVGESMPSIAGLPEDYLKSVMMGWKSGKRPSASMTRLISGLTDEEIAALAKHYAKLPWVPAKQKTDARLVKLGQEASSNCSGCHGDTGKSEDADTPSLNGQWSQYLRLEVLKYRDDAFGMTHKKMIKATKKLSEEEIKAVAEFYASQNK